MHRAQVQFSLQDRIDDLIVGEIAVYPRMPFV